MHQCYFTSLTCRRKSRLQRVHQNVAVTLAVVGDILIEQNNVRQFFHNIVAVDLWLCAGEVALNTHTPVAHQMIPEHLQPRMRDRKRYDILGIGNTIAVLHKSGVECIEFDRFVHTLWIGSRTTRRIHQQFPGFRIAF
ncbi:hypothetical protein D3C75_1097170 [compost metagenome]